MTQIPSPRDPSPRPRRKPRRSIPSPIADASISDAGHQDAAREPRVARLPTQTRRWPDMRAATGQVLGRASLVVAGAMAGVAIMVLSGKANPTSTSKQPSSPPQHQPNRSTSERGKHTPRPASRKRTHQPKRDASWPRRAVSPALREARAASVEQTATPPTQGSSAPETPPSPEEQSGGGLFSP